MEFLGVITQKEATGASLFGEKKERVFGGELGWGVVRDEKGVRCVSPDEYESLLSAHRAKKSKTTKQEEFLNV